MKHIIVKFSLGAVLALFSILMTACPGGAGIPGSARAACYDNCSGAVEGCFLTGAIVNQALCVDSFSRSSCVSSLTLFDIVSCPSAESVCQKECDKKHKY